EIPRSAWRETRPDHVAEERSAASHPLRERPGSAVLQIGDQGTEFVIREIPAESSLEDRERELPGQSTVYESGALPVRLVDREVCLGVSELGKESVFEDIDFVQIVTHPGVHRHVADIAGVDHGAIADLTLDAEIPLLDVRLPDVRVHSKKRVVSEGQG